ncbi:hypothetical protein R1sor_008050 [Riccia sorocarpa]|uniref:Legume lectin domain-containing protein n=1 Tax=Riccia sorocarpa TaxID=122646 RepID=A0ABD3HYJ4_9MARC
MMLMLLMTILMLLFEVKAQGPVDFDFPLFDDPASHELLVLNNARVDTFHEELKVSDPTNSSCDSHYCQGQIFYSKPIDIIDSGMQSTYSFSTSFVFSVTSPTFRGEGFVFLLTSDPNENPGSAVGSYFGVYPNMGKRTSPTIAVEFDTLKNTATSDLTDNHVGVDADTAVSLAQARIYGRRFNDGVKFQVWIHYLDSSKHLQIRLAAWSANVVEPTTSAIDLNFNLTEFAANQMYAGFSANTYSSQEQEVAIYSWSFKSTLDDGVPPPPVSSNGSPPFVIAGNHTRKNHTLSREEKIVLGFCIGGGLCLIFALGCCFWLGHYWGRTNNDVPGEDDDDHKKKNWEWEVKESVVELSTGDGAKADNQTKTLDEEINQAEQGIFASSRASSLETASTDAGDSDSTSTALTQESTTEEFIHRKSARELQAEGVKADAIRRGLLYIGLTGSEHARFPRETNIHHDESFTGTTPELKEAREILNDPEEKNESASYTDSRREDAEIAYEVDGKPSVPVDRSKSWSIWIPPKNPRHSSQSGNVTPRASVKIKTKRFWTPWRSDVDREVELVLKKPTLEGSSVTSTTENSESSLPGSQENAPMISTPPEMIMFSNTLYDAPLEESHQPSLALSPSPEDEFAEQILDIGIPKRDTEVEQIFDIATSSTSQVDTSVPVLVDNQSESQRGTRRSNVAGISTSSCLRRLTSTPPPTT